MNTHNCFKTLALATIFCSPMFATQQDVESLHKTVAMSTTTDTSYAQMADKAATLATTIKPVVKKHHQTKHVTAMVEKYHQENNPMLDGPANKAARETISVLKGHNRTNEIHLKNAEQHIRLADESIKKIYDVSDTQDQEARATLKSLHEAVAKSSPRKSQIIKNQKHEKSKADKA